MRVGKLLLVQPLHMSWERCLSNSDLPFWEQNQDNSVKLSKSLVSEKKMAASVRYVTLPDPALSDLCPAVPLFTTFGSNLD